MFSILKPDFVYTDISEDITENDIDVVSDLWSMDGRDVYRGSRDPRYTHANVYWLYDENLCRVGCSEHSTADHADVRLLWLHESEFATLLQEEGWRSETDIWSILPRQTFDRFVNEGWTKPEAFLQQCLKGPLRIVTPSMIVQMPTVRKCAQCGDPSCPDATSQPLDFPDKQKIVFVDNDMIVHIPPNDSSVWSRLGLQHDDDSSQQEPEPEQEQPQTRDSPPEQPEP